jgi:hypothetical protein
MANYPRGLQSCSFRFYGRPLAGSAVSVGVTYSWQSCSCSIDGTVNLVSGRAVHVNAKAVIGAGQAVSVEGRVFPTDNNR